MHDVYFHKGPAYVGTWCVGGIGGLRFRVTKRPTRLQRFVAGWLLGWEWLPDE